MHDFLVPLDRTGISEAGLRWASGAAYRSGGRLRLISVIDRASSDREAARAKDYLKKHVAEVTSDGITASYDVIAGDPSEVILREAWTADIVVMTSGTTRWVVSAVLDKVLQAMVTPLVVVRGDKGALIGAANLDSIMVPISRTDYSSSAIPVAADFARALNAKLVLFQNVEATPESQTFSGVPPVVDKDLRLHLEAAEEHVDECAALLRATGLEVDTLVSSGDPATEILNAARSIGAGLVAMATRGRNRLESRISGSVANVVIETSTTPCLIVRVTTDSLGDHGVRSNPGIAAEAQGGNIVR